MAAAFEQACHYEGCSPYNEDDNPNDHSSTEYRKGRPCKNSPVQKGNGQLDQPKREDPEEQKCQFNLFRSSALYEPGTIHLRRHTCFAVFRRPLTAFASARVPPNGTARALTEAPVHHRIRVFAVGLASRRDRSLDRLRMGMRMGHTINLEHCQPS